ncbi:MAG: MBL fold metallo-hydrolase [Desulfosalsimonas sp.]
MQIKQFRYGADNLGYLVYGDKTAMAVDGGAAEQILRFVRDRNLALRYVTNTHSHMDHTTGNRHLLSGSDARFIDFNTLIGQTEIQMEGQSIRVLHTPGHTADSVCFYFDSILISGDTLFNGKVGRCFTGDHQRFLASIKTLVQLPGDTAVYAGHDYVEEYVAFARNLEPDNEHLDPYLAKYDPDHVCATLDEERHVDPFLRFNDDKIIAILKARGLPAETEEQRWESLMSLM